ncbi:glutamate decarboxylase [Xylariaceae sp. FL0662B]|nr:glutamate decarboxylase [Xylariaceae sp. FL0662B]
MSSHVHAVDVRNGVADTPLNRADEVDDLIDAVKSLIIPYVRDADAAAPSRARGQVAASERNVLVDPHAPEELVKKLAFSLPDGEGRGKAGLLDTIQTILRYSVNTWDQGFLDKLYASTNAVGVVSELLLSVHIYTTSPALTVIEKTTSRHLASLFGFTGPHAGGLTCPGGSGSNLTSLITARNTLYPETKRHGNGGHAFAVFTSAHGHYSIEKAAVAAGMGSDAVLSIDVDDDGRMRPAALRSAIARARAAGRTPLYVNATAGTTVLGSFDPLGEIADACAEAGLWLHVDASWGGGAALSARDAQRRKLAGAHRADSVTVNPHKMLNVPLTCSFLLAPDVRVFRRANSLPAGYLFHGPDADAGEAGGEGEGEGEVWDLADLTLQCGRRGDSLKLALAWIYYGRAGLGAQVDGAFDVAARLAALIDEAPDFLLLSTNPPPCLQVCFYYAPGGVLADDKEENTRRTREMVAALVRRGFMVDYAPGDRGSFFRVVVNCQTLRGTVEGLVVALKEVGREVVAS